MASLPIGLQLSDYQIDRVLGSGGAGVTYRALDTRRRCWVAVKEYFPKQWARRLPSGAVQLANSSFEREFRWGLDCFLKEAETLARFRHRGIVKVERVFAAMGTAMMQVEYVAGPNVEQWVRDHNASPPEHELEGFTAALLASLSAVHRAGVLHRDVAPRNILLDERRLPVLIDFGSARQAVATGSISPALMITPHFAAQEQYISDGSLQGPWTDIYAAAAVLYFVIARKPPAAAPTRAIEHRKIELRSLPNAKRYRPGFLSAIERALEFFPQDRPPSVEAWRALLFGGGGTG